MKRHALLVAALIGLASSAFAQSPASKVISWTDYRLNVEFLTGAGGVPDSTLRFPKLLTNTNNLINEQAANQTLRHSVQWVHATLLTGTTDQLIGVWSRAFPAGVDTFRLTSSVRTFSIGGVDIDSMRTIANAANSISILVTDGH